MYYDNQVTEESRNKARIATAITAILVFISLFVITFSVNAKKNDDEEGILVNFGTTDFGSGDVQPQQKNDIPVVEPIVEPKISEPSANQKAAPKQKISEPVKTKPTLTQSEETAVLDKNKKKVTTPDKTSKKTTPDKSTENDTGKDTKTSPSTDQTNQKKDPEVNKRALYPGKTTVNSGGEGNDSKAGDKGQRDGSPEKGAYEGTNSGLGKSGVGYSLSGRKLINAPAVEDNSNIEGKITISIKVDQNGKVIAASLGTPTTISNNALVQKAIAAAKQAKFDANKTASEEQFGTITFVFKVR